MLEEGDEPDNKAARMNEDRENGGERERREEGAGGGGKEVGLGEGAETGAAGGGGHDRRDHGLDQRQAGWHNASAGRVKVEGEERRGRGRRGGASRRRGER
eukprot:753883-Hanusia_phi.AAC.3